MTDIPQYITKSLGERDIELYSLFCDLADGVFKESGLAIDKNLLVSLDWVSFPKSSRTHGSCHLFSGGRIGVFLDARYMGHSMESDLKRLLAHEMTHFWQYQQYLRTGRDDFLDLNPTDLELALGYTEGHGEFFLNAVNKLNTTDRELLLTPKNVGFDAVSKLIEPRMVVLATAESAFSRYPCTLGNFC